MGTRDDLNFLEFIQSFRRGELLREGDEQLNKVVSAMRDNGGDGKITLDLAFKLNKAGQIECTPKLTTKVPQKPLGTGIYFATDEGHLTRRDPDQYDIEDEIERRRSSEQAHAAE